MKFPRNNKGETLAETIIALSILAIGITVASTIIINSMRNLTNAKNRVTAVNIAREGIEAIRNIRDTNWLFYSDRRRTCWNHDPDLANSPCTGITPILPGIYIVYKDVNNSWQLESADINHLADGPDNDSILENDLDPDIIKLSLVNISDAAQPTGDWDGDSQDNQTDADDDGDGILDVDDPLPLDDQNYALNARNLGDMYNHTTVSDFFGGRVSPTAFTRYITIEYLENQPGADSQIHPPNDAIDIKGEWDVATDATALNRMRITSTVQWTRGAVHSAELTTIISDHLGRETLDN